MAGEKYGERQKAQSRNCCEEGPRRSFSFRLCALAQQCLQTEGAYWVQDPQVSGDPEYYTDTALSCYVDQQFSSAFDL